MVVIADNTESGITTEQFYTTVKLSEFSLFVR